MVRKLLITIQIFVLFGLMIPMATSAETVAGSCAWETQAPAAAGEVGNLVCNVGYETTVTLDEGYTLETFSVGTVTAEYTFENLPVGEDVTTATPYVVAEITNNGAAQNTPLDIQGLPTNWTGETTITASWTIGCSSGFVADGSTCVAEQPDTPTTDENPAPTPTPTPNTDTSHGTGFEQGAIQDAEARRIIIVSILTALVVLGGCIYLYIRYGWRDTGFGRKKGKKGKNKVDYDPSTYKAEKEIEFKTKLTENEYRNLQSKILTNEKHALLEQVNWYFDTPKLDNIAKNIAVRIRQENHEYELCIKIKHETYNNELNVKLDKENAEEIIRKGKLDLRDFKLESYVENYKLHLITKLVNVRYEYTNKLAIIALDHSKYGEVKEFELEIEYPKYEQGKVYFEEYLKANNIIYKPIKPKVARAFAEYKRTHSK